MATLANLARMSTATTGTGTITLGSAVPGHLTFSDAGITNGQTVTYAIEDGSDSEIGRGVYTSAGTSLTRATILNSTNGGAAISLSGTAQVFISPAAQDFPGYYRCKVKKASDLTGQNLTAGASVTFDTEVFDVGGWHDTGSNTERLTVPSGLGISCVIVTGNISIANDTPDRWHSFYITHYNSSSVAQGVYIGDLGTEHGAGSWGSCVHTGPVSVSAGDYFVLSAQTESDTSVDIEADHAYLSIVAIG